MARWRPENGIWAVLWSSAMRLLEIRRGSNTDGAICELLIAKDEKVDKEAAGKFEKQHPAE